MRDTMLKAFLTDDAGEVAISYGLIAALISIVAIVGFSQLSLSTAELYQWITSVIEKKN